MMKMEIELQIKKNCEIPNLKPDFSFTDAKLKVYDNELFFKNKKYKMYLLDQFPETLEEEEDIKLKIIDNEFCRLKEENKYIKFLQIIFKKNSSQAKLFDLGTDFSDIEICLDKINRMDQIDKYIILNLYKNFFNSNIYHINDEILFNFFIKGFLREAISGIIYFDNIDIFISYGYDMVLPIYINSEEKLIKYKKKANEFGLFIRR
ncbi:hypothetical protein EDC58_1484 [Caminibacter pacificus]|uniref:Uncharacterized protein n=3 Tax=Caminibacter pacificus TaxID=1424653 RepID=A0AAJ4UXS9_9BACT|nr:hypothetical protein EDC58_1484 [Caminibacter pacificus]